MNQEKPRLYVLDTNVLMHDPTALFRFQEHDIFLPMMVLEELDKGKKGLSEVSQNVRQASRFLDGMISQAPDNDITHGIDITNSLASDYHVKASGKLFFQTESFENRLPQNMPQSLADNQILNAVLGLTHDFPDHQVVLVSKDINLRIKSAVLGLAAEDYNNDKVLEDADLLYSGEETLPENFWDIHSKTIDAWQEKSGRTFYKIEAEDLEHWYPNQCIYLNDDTQPFQAMVRSVDHGQVTIETAHDFTQPNHSVWGINARNRGQNFALNMLMDPEIDFVTLLGTAGTGKTLLTLAAGLAQVMDDNLYSEIIMTRATISVGEDIGFLPGTEEEKMTPWMGALMDNLEVLNSTEGGEWGRQATEDLLKRKIRIHSMNFMRGRTFLNKYIILDEAQNLTAKQMKTLITRAGPGTKIVCLGNIAQIDTPYLTETTSGLTYVVDRFKQCEFGGHITLTTGERSRLADFASTNL